MKFQLTDELKNLMTSKDLDNIVLETKIRSCWSGSYAEVSAKFGNSPKNGFDVHEVDGFRVYVQPGIKADKEIVTLGLEKMLFLERITIDGIRTIWQCGAKYCKTLTPHPFLLNTELGAMLKGNCFMSNFMINPTIIQWSPHAHFINYSIIAPCSFH